MSLEKPFEICCNPETSYQNAEKLFKDIQKYDFGITRKGVKSWLEAQPAYTQHKKPSKTSDLGRRFRRRIADRFNFHGYRK